MADFTLTIPDDQVDRVVEALCHASGYAGDPQDDKAARECARAYVVQFVRRTVVQVEQEKAMAAAMASVPAADPIEID